MRSTQEIKEAITMLAKLGGDVAEEIEETSELILEDRIKALEMLHGEAKHHTSVLLTFMWLYGKATDEELLMGQIPVASEYGGV